MRVALDAPRGDPARRPSTDRRAVRPLVSMTRVSPHQGGFRMNEGVQMAVTGEPVRNGSTHPAPRLSPNALRVLKKRYLAKDERGQVTETPQELFERVARNIAQAERLYGPEADAAWREHGHPAGGSPRRPGVHRLQDRHEGDHEFQHQRRDHRSIHGGGGA